MKKHKVTIIMITLFFIGLLTLFYPTLSNYYNEKNQSKTIYNYENILKAVRLVIKGARLIGTNSDVTGPSEDGIIPACRSMIAPIEMATGKTAYFVGKPNPLMMRTGLRILGDHSENAVMIGDRMDTDIVAGIETGLDTVLVLSGVTDMDEVKKFPYRPKYILKGVGDIPGCTK